MYPPPERWKRPLWYAMELVRGRTADHTPLDIRDEAGRQDFYESGVRQLARLEERIEAETGFTIDSSCRVLDYGCGVGRIALPLAERCEHVYGIDVSDAALRQADIKAKALELTNVDWLSVDRLSEVSGRYDLLISMFVFQHIRRRPGEQLFGTLLRGLRPGGVGAIQFTLNRPPSLKEQLYSLGKIYSLNRIGNMLAAEGVRDWHVRFHPHAGTEGYYDGTIVFRKPAEPQATVSVGARAEAELEPAAS